MVDITLKVNLDTVIDEMNDLFKKQVPFAAYRAINASVYKGSVDVKKAMPFFMQGGPVPFTDRGVSAIFGPAYTYLMLSGNTCDGLSMAA